MKKLILLTTCLALILSAGCGDDDENNVTTNNTTANNVTTPNNTTANNTTPNNTTPNNTTPNNTTPNNTTPNNTTPNNQNRLEAHDCTFDTAMDMTGQATVTITDISAWSVPHSACIIVDAGTDVVWEGSFAAHPLEGGVTPTQDAASPIDAAGPGDAGTPSITVTFDTAGDFPYFCGIHTMTMTGVVYVQ